MSRLGSPFHRVTPRTPRDTRCIVCRGRKMLCGKKYCPVLLRYYAKERVTPLVDKLTLDGSSPPAVFVGRYGYPKVSLGPMVTPTKGDTSFLDIPEQWVGKSIREIVNFRSMLVRGKKKCVVRAKNKLIDNLQELTLSNRSVDVEAFFTKKPSGRIIFSDSTQPWGPSAPLKKLEIGNPRVDHRLEHAWYDIDLNAKEAVLDLYTNKVRVSSIQRAFSMGVFGIGKRRKLVPTRWSITAVDSIISIEQREDIKHYPTVDKFRVYETRNLDNLVLLLLIPSSWQYELIEAWYPGTTWNPYGKKIHLYADSEGYRGRKDYPEIGGCYFAARLAVTEALKRERRQAGVIVFREVHPGYLMPVGVWNVREHVRKALLGKPKVFDTLSHALAHIKSRLKIRIDYWVSVSRVLRELKTQKRIEDYAC